MKINLPGLISNCQKCLTDSSIRKANKEMLNCYAYTLGEMLDNLRNVAADPSQLDKFLKLYCLETAQPLKNENSA